MTEHNNYFSNSPDPDKNNAFYFPQSKISETVRSFSYTGEDKLPVLISRNDIATKNDGGVTNILNNDTLCFEKNCANRTKEFSRINQKIDY